MEGALAAHYVRGSQVVGHCVCGCRDNNRAACLETQKNILHHSWGVPVCLRVNLWGMFDYFCIHNDLANVGVVVACRRFSTVVESRREQVCVGPATGAIPHNTMHTFAAVKALSLQTE